MVDGLVGERTLRERYWRDQRMARAGREALALAALPTRRASARLLELAAGRWTNPQGHPTTDADRYAAWTSRGHASATDDPALRLATAWLRLPGVPDRAHRALTEVFGDDPEAAAAALATAWSLLDPTPGILCQVDDAQQARDAVWLLEAGHPWPGPTSLGMDRAVLDALRSQAPRAADRLAILHLTPAPADGLAAAPVLAAPESVAPEPEATASTAPESAILLSWYSVSLLCLLPWMPESLHCMSATSRSLAVFVAATRQRCGYCCWPFPDCSSCSALRRCSPPGSSP